MFGARKRIVRMQRMRLGILEIFEDDGGFEHRLVADPEHRHLAERRNLQEPVGLVIEIDIDPFEWHALLGERNHCALHVRAELVADERKFIRHCTSPVWRMRRITFETRHRVTRTAPRALRSN